MYSLALRQFYGKWKWLTIGISLFQSQAIPMTLNQPPILGLEAAYSQTEAGPDPIKKISA